MDFEQHLEEAMSFAGVLDVRELRALYYGRINILCSFSDDGEPVLDQSEKKLPRCILAYDLEDIVGKRVSSHLLYGLVYRKNIPPRQEIVDIRNYDIRMFGRDTRRIRDLDLIPEPVLDFYLEQVNSNPRLRNHFQKLWELTWMVSGDLPDSREAWRQLLVDLGYEALKDPMGTLFGRTRTTLVLSDENLDMLDIVPVQMHRKEIRSRIRDTVDRKVKRLALRRQRVSKVPDLRPARGKKKTLIRSALSRIFR